MVASVDGVFEESLPLPKIVEGGKVDAVFNCWIFDIGFTERGCGEETAVALYRRERERDWKRVAPRWVVAQRKVGATFEL
jgi:hypothetical protein